MLSPEPVQPSVTKPNLARRASSKFAAPHKGQEFSVDDDAEEYESEQAARKVSSVKSMTGSQHPLRRQTSTLRRRPTAQPSTLPRVDSRGEDE